MPKVKTKKGEVHFPYSPAGMAAAEDMKKKSKSKKKKRRM